MLEFECARGAGIVRHTAQEADFRARRDAGKRGYEDQGTGEGPVAHGGDGASLHEDSASSMLRPLWVSS